ncbi:MAG TPA: hypothetical protein VMH01_12180 [Puia sp.]|nr:hypothetical protein [Puia sp.]
MKRPFFFILGISCFASCHKTEVSPDKGWTWFGTSDPVVYNYVLINANQVTNLSDTNEFHIDISAAFVDSNNNRITGVDNLSVNKQVIDRSVDSTYSFDYAQSGYLNEGLALFGTNVIITIKGSSDADTASQTVYLPKRIVQAITDFPNAVNTTKDLTLKWIPDPNNTWGRVIIQIYYYGNLSQRTDSTLPSQLKTVNYTVADNGIYTIPSHDLQGFPDKSYISIAIARGTQTEVVLPVSRKRVFYFSNSSASTPPLMVSASN